MNILLFNNRYPSDAKPHVATYIATIKALLEKAGNHVSLLADTSNKSSNLGQKIALLKYYYTILTYKKIKQFDLYYINHFTLYWWLVRHQIDIQRAVIHWHGSEIFGKGFFSVHSIKKETLHQLMHIVPSHYFKHEVIKATGIPENRFMISPSGGIDTNTFIPTEKNDTGNKIVIGFASHLVSEKGADLLYQLAKRKRHIERVVNKTIHIKAIRYGIIQNSFEAKLLEADIELTSPIEKKDMPGFYQSVDLLLFPTKRKAESLGLVPLEAMACGIPILGTNDFAIPEYVIPGISGELFTLNNYAEFEEKVIFMLQNLSQYTPREIVLKKYSQSKVIEDYKTLISRFERFHI